MADRERLFELTDIAASDPGAPSPVIYATERKIVVAYYLAPSATGDGEGGASGVVIFERVDSHLFGSPNDEALQGHRLAKLGLRPYSFYEVRRSTWIADLQARNRVHPGHRDSSYADLRHFIFTFHDTTLEVAARTYSASVEPDDPIDCVCRRLDDRRAWR
jgi:hypothetical protein